jgi:hypothetical protein
MQAKVESISELRDLIYGKKGLPREYVDKMLHAVPEIPIVKDRKAYLIEKSKDKIVLDIGCTGPISKEIRTVAKQYYGVDNSPGDWEVCDIDHRPDQLPKHEDVEVIILSEVLEHLANPGYFLLALKEIYPGRTIYLTVPNAGAYKVIDDAECVHKDHVCWYSYTTLKTLLTRYGFEIKEARWYGNGPRYHAEGIIAVIQ